MTYNKILEELVSLSSVSVVYIQRKYRMNFIKSKELYEEWKVLKDSNV